MSFESPESASVEHRQEETIPFPHAESAIEAYLGEYKGKTERADELRDFFQEFLDEEIENTGIFESEDGIAMPYTSISTKALAHRIYEKTTGKKLADEVGPQAPRKQKFIFATSPDLNDGDQFTTVEFAMHDSVMAVSSALEKLKRGEELEDEEIFTVGMPTNVLGKIPPELAEKIAAQPFDELAKPYAELIGSKIKKGDEAPEGVELLGMSLGANLAIRTGERLIGDRVVTQDHKEAKENETPYLQIRADVPVSLGPSKIKKVQIMAGFVADGILEAGRPDVRKNILGPRGKEFKQATRARLAEKGITEQMSDEDKKTKTKVRNQIILSLGKGLKPKPGTKVTETYGLRDLTSITPGLRREARKRREEHEGTLGQGMLSRTSKNERRFAANMMHMNPWFRKNELRRMDALARRIQSLKEGAH